MYVNCNHLNKLGPAGVDQVPSCNTTCFLYRHRTIKVWCHQYDRLPKSRNVFLSLRSKHWEGKDLVRFTMCFCDEETLHNSSDELSNYDQGVNFSCFPKDSEQALIRCVSYV